MNNNITAKAYGNLKPIKGKILNNILESKNDVYLTKKEDIIDEIIKIVNNESNKNIYIGIISDESAKRIFSDTHLNLKDYRILLNSSDIRHWYNRHVLNYAKMVPMTIKDLLNGIDLLNNYSSISYEKLNKSYKIIVKAISHKQIIMINLVSSKKKRISIKTIYFDNKKIASKTMVSA